MRPVPRIVLLALALTLLGLVALFIPAPGALAAPCPQDRPIPYGWHLRPEHPCAGDSVTVVFEACLPCVDLIGAGPLPDGGFALRARMMEVCPAVAVCFPDSVELPLGAFAAGHHLLTLEVVADVVQGDSSAICTVVHHDSLAFEIGCPPPQGPLPYVDVIRIGPPPPCRGCPPPPVCPHQPFPVFIAGTFPNNCLQFRRIEVVPPPEASPEPRPPIVRIVAAVNDCMGWPCNDLPEHWSGAVELPPLPPGAYLLPVQLMIVSMCDSTKVDTTYATRVPFRVAESCPPSLGCLLVDWDHSGRTGGPCDALVSPDRPAQVTMTMRTNVPLAGLQGALHLGGPGLRIAQLEPVGPAAGMRLTWQQTADGARFVMFADHGAPIPGCGPADDSTNVGLCPPLRILRVTVAIVPGGTPQPQTLLYATELLGADSTGAGVPECPIATLVMPAATICLGALCDFNGDGHADVRDLVIMVHCVLGSGPCPDTSRAHLDCNRDGQVNIEDVLCCARSILRGGGRDTIPGRPEPGVQVSFGPPVVTSSGVDVTARLAGADRLGAARLALEFPADRYDVSAVDLGGAPADWMHLYEVDGSRLIVGLIGLPQGGTQAATGELALVLRLALKPGQSQGGEVRVAEGEFSGPDGAALEVKLGQPGLRLFGPPRLKLAPSQPNPFTRETRFGVTLDHAADVDVAIHDLSGRLVATLFHGALPAGTRTFTWDGRRADGSAAPNGLYFTQVRAGGEQAARKIVYLRGN